METLGALGNDQAFWHKVENHEESPLPSNDRDSSRGRIGRHHQREITALTEEVELAIEWAHLGGD